MDEDLKKIQNSSLGKYLKKQGKKTKSTGRKSAKPEQKAVHEICLWLKTHGFSYDIVEASKFDRHLGRMVVDTKITPGHSDIVATDKYGFSCHIEVKAKGKRSTLKEHQKEFLKHKILNNGFAVCADSSEYLDRAYREWLRIKSTHIAKGLHGLQSGECQRFLLAQLPEKRQSKSKQGFLD